MVTVPWKILMGTVLCQFSLTSILVVGWTYRLMQRRALKRWWSMSPARLSGTTFAEFLSHDAATREHQRFPNWAVRPNAIIETKGALREASGLRGKIRALRQGMFGSLWRNAVLGFQGIVNTWVLTFLPTLFWVFGWYSGWDNSFNKGYEQFSVGIDGEEYYIKPMNCPFHIQIYKSRPRSYRELPLRLAEFGTVYRYERSGTLHGMTRVRGFTQDDAHIFCTPEQLGQEVRNALRFSIYVLREFGLDDITAYLSTKPPEKSIGDDAAWDSAQDDLRAALEAENVTYKVDEGGGAFYGPKIDLKLNDALGREWQLSTVQLDFNLPERFDMHYIAPSGEKQRPYMVHRALFGSVERFFALLIEHYKGAFPLWLAPKQVMIVPITDDQHDYSYDVLAQLKQRGLRVAIDPTGERMNAKIRDAQEEKIPYVLVIGKKEVKDKTVSVRERTQGDLGPMTLENFLASIKDDLAQGTATALPPLD